jgi:hypothetical protein
MKAPSNRVNVSERFAVDAHKHVARLDALIFEFFVPDSLNDWPVADCHEMQSDAFPRDGHVSQHMLGVVDSAYTNARSSRRLEGFLSPQLEPDQNK